MANEFKHKDPGSTLTQAEFITSDGTGHIFASQAAGDILYASSTTVLTRLAKGSDDDLLTLSSGAPAWTSSPTLTALTVDDVVINGKVVTMTGSSGDTAVFTVGTNGTLSLVTTDAAASAADLTLDADGEIVIDAADAAGVIIKINGTAQLSVVDGSITPTTNNDIDLGTSSYQFKDGYFDGNLEADAITIGGDNVLSGSIVTTLGTVSAGTWEGTTIAVDQGGTGATSLADHYVLVGSNTSAITPITPSTSGYVLTSTGTGSDPSFQAAAGGVSLALVLALS